MRTYSPKAGEITRTWHVVDATDVVLGRLASQIAILLRGKHKPTFAPHMDGGDFVIVINAEKVALTGSKREQKIAYRHSVTQVASLQRHTQNSWNPIQERLSKRQLRECSLTTSSVVSS